MAIIDSVINPLQSQSQLYKMKLSELAARFDEKYGTQFKFKDLGVGKLKTFIQQSAWFKLSPNPHDPKDEYVEQCQPPPRKRPSLDSIFGDADPIGYVTSSSVVVDDETSDAESELDGYQTCRSKLGTPRGTPCESPFKRNSAVSPVSFGSFINTDETPWQPIPQRKGKGVSRNLFGSKAASRKLQNFETITEDRLKILMSKPPGKALKFNPEQYYDNPAFFTRDIVSMWNTPNRETSYIVIGVVGFSTPTHDLVGLKQPQKIDAVFQDKFLHSNFSYKPPFRYSETTLDGKRYGVIVIPSSQGYSDDVDDEGPCYAENNNTDGLWHQGDILLCAPENAVCGTKGVGKIIKWFSAGQNLNQQQSRHKDPFSEESRKAWELFKSQIGEFNDRKAYSLVVSRCTTEVKHLKALGNINWCKVWDFDPEGRDNGALNVCEPVMESRIKVSTWKDEAEDSLSDTSTDWVFVRGLMSRDDSMVPTRKAKEWASQVKLPLDDHCKQLMRYCETRPLTVVILWYDNFDYIPHLHRLLMKIDDSVPGTEFVLCMAKVPGCEDYKASIHSLCEQFDINKVVEISLDRLCYEMSCCGSAFQPNQDTRYQLPVAEGTGNSKITERDYSWLHQEMDILYKELSHNTQHRPYSHDQPQEQDKEFFRGGLLEWNDAHMGTCDAKRSIYDEVMKQLNGFIGKGTSTVVTIYHEPGAGGTTLSRRILWDIHDTTPCVSLTGTTLNVNEVAERIMFLYEITHLPLVVLIDGKETCLVHELLQKLPDCHLIILCVQRYTRQIGNQVHKGCHHWLQGKVEYAEAEKLARVFSYGLSGAKQKHLQEVVSEVSEQHAHFVYEFGLIAHAEKYRGIIPYVQGYLNLTPGNLKPWQLAIGYLSLAAYYGHSSLPCQFFTGVFGLKQSEVVTLDALTHNGQQFIVEDSRKLNWKITHHIVAKEILEQILSPRRAHESRKCDSGNKLSRNAKMGLAAFAIKFISYVKEQIERKKFYDPHSAVVTVVKTIFIQRDYKETGLDDISMKKQKLSRMISDVYENTTDEEDDLSNESKLRIMKHLAESFPEDPLFTAHYARALGIFRSSYDEALLQLEKARKIKKSQSHRRSSMSHSDDTKDSTLSTIYHISGTIYHKKIMALSGGGKLSKVPNTSKSTNGNFQETLSKVLGLAKVAVGHFKKCREFCTKGMDESYGYVGEIKLRLHFVDYLEINYDGGFYGFLEATDVNSEEGDDAYMFAQSCFQEVDCLLREYQDKIGTSTTDELDQCLNWFFALFHDPSTALQYWNDRDDIEGRRSKIAVIKCKQSKDGRRNKQNYAAILDGFQSEDDLQEVVKLYEKNMDEAYQFQIDVSLDLRDWMYAIRHRFQRKLYNIDSDVLHRVQQCYGASPSSHFALYYLYVLNTTLAIIPGSSTRHLAESMQLQEKLKKMRIYLSKLKRLMAYEWVGVDDRGIHRLVHRQRLGTWDSETRFWKDPGVVEKLQIFRGTIVKCTHAAHGIISISTGNNTRHDLQAFFVPKASQLFGKMHKNKEVEFFIGFNIEHGIGAYNVRELKRVVCTFCGNSLLVSSLVRSECRKCHRVVRGEKVS